SRIHSLRLGRLLSLRLVLFAFASVLTPCAQPVKVTMLLDTNRVAIGQTTILHVFAEIAPEEKPATLQIFSWYVDLLNDDPAVATADYSQLKRPTSDQDPKISSAGVTDGANRRGIFDTFLNLA